MEKIMIKFRFYDALYRMLLIFNPQVAFVIDGILQMLT